MTATGPAALCRLERIPEPWFIRIRREENGLPPLVVEHEGTTWKRTKKRTVGGWFIYEVVPNETVPGVA